MDLRNFFQRSATSAKNDVAEQKKIDSSCSQASDKPTDSESQTDSDNGADDILINLNVDNRARKSDRGDRRDVIADTTNHTLVNGAVTYAQDIAVCLFCEPRGVHSFRTKVLGSLNCKKLRTTGLDQYLP